MKEDILLGFLEYLREDIRDEARRFFQQESLEKEQYLYIDQDEATHMYLVELGTLEANIVHGDGKVYILNFLYPGNIFGEGALYEEGVYSYSVVAREPSEVWRISWDDMQWLVSRDPDFALQILRMVIRKLDHAYYKDRCIAGEKVEKRIACILLKMINERGINEKCGVLIDTPITNRDIAGLVGSTEETVSRIMSRLKKEDILSTEDKLLVVKDRESLLDYFDGI